MNKLLKAGLLLFLACVGTVQAFCSAGLIVIIPITAPRYGFAPNAFAAESNQNL